MSHANDGLDYPGGTGAVHQFSQAGNKGLAAFQAKALGSRVFLAQVLFETLGRNQAIQDASLDAVSVATAGARTFHALLHPHFFGLVLDVHVFGANRRTVGLLKHVQDFPEAGFGIAKEQIAGLEPGIEVSFRQTVVLQ